LRRAVARFLCGGQQGDPEAAVRRRKTTLTLHVTRHGKAVKGIHVRITRPMTHVRTRASNGKGFVKQALKMKKAGILIFTPITSGNCNTKRVGVTNVFTPPVTG